DWFLAGSTASSAAGLTAGAIALVELFSVRNVPSAMGFAAIAASLLATASGVVRMRGWAILLGAATSLVLLLCAMAVRHHPPLSIALCLAAAPPFLFHILPVLVARLRSDAAPVRVDVTDTSSLARYGIGFRTRRSRGRARRPGGPPIRLA